MAEPNGEGIHAATDDPARQANQPETEAAARPEDPALAEVRERAQRAIAGVPSSSASSVSAATTAPVAASPMTWNPDWIPASVQPRR